MSIFGRMIQCYKDKFVIPHLDAAELAETNRFHTVIVSFTLFLFGIGDLAAIVISHPSNIREHLSSLIYFSIYTFISLAVYIYSVKVRDCPKEKAYFWKNIQLYIYIFTMLPMSLYNFFLFGQPFNGFLTFLLIFCICLGLFSLSPIFLFIGVAGTLSIMAPGIYKHFHLTGLADCILVTIVIFALSLYRRAIEKKQIILIKKQKFTLEAKTFGNFTLLNEGKVIKFSRTKSNELMAYLIYKNGSSVNTKELLAVLYGDRADSANYGSSLRNLVVDIKHVMKELNIMNFFIAEYNSFRINPEIVKCDYYDFLTGDKNALNTFAGEFMNQYSWAEETAAFLEMKVTK